MRAFQTTLKDEVRLKGFGVHSGLPAEVIIRPAKIDHKIVFVRIDPNSQRHFIPLDRRHAILGDGCTSLVKDGYFVKTIEHLMAAIVAFGLDNLEIEVIGEEIPILDGSAAVFVNAFERVGILAQEAKRNYLRIVKPARIDFSYGFAEFLPFDGCRYDVSIAFRSRHIQEQSYIHDLNSSSFKQDIALARTFGFIKDVAFLHERGLARGSSLENSIVIDEEDKILNKNGLFYPDEFVRHKLLDAIGDSSLIGYPFIGCFRSLCSGHRYNAEVGRLLLEDKSAYEIIQFEENHVKKL